MVAFFVGLGIGLVGGGAVVYLYYKTIVADLNAGITDYRAALEFAQKTVATFKTDVGKVEKVL